MSVVDDHLIELTISVVRRLRRVPGGGRRSTSRACSRRSPPRSCSATSGPGRVLSARRGTDAIDTVWEFLAYLLTAIVFLLVGLVIPPAALLGDLGPIVWAIVAILVGRARSSSTAWSAARRASRRLAGLRTGRCRRPWLARPVLVRPARCRGRRDGARATGRRAAAGAAPGARLRGGAVHAARPGDDDRAARAARARPTRSP